MNRESFKLWKYSIELITKGQQRSVDAKKNIIALFFIKGISIAVSLVLVPLTINYINPTQYGIWLTLSSIVVWFGFFDIGFGNGLRNKFAEAKASGNQYKARVYISTTYAVLILIFLVLWVIFFITNFFIDWSRILNAPRDMAQELSKLALLVFSFFCLQMIFKTISTVLIADQKPAKAAVLDMASQLLALLIIVILTLVTRGSLILLGLTIGFTPILVLTISSFFLFRNNYKQFAPSFNYVQFYYARDIMKLGYKFFIIQIAAIILFQSSTIIIAQLYGPEQVTSYNIAYKYFAIIPMIFSIIITPFWSACTEAWIKNDLAWIKTVVRKLQYIWLILTMSTILMLIVSRSVYRLWVGEEILIPVSVSVSLSLFVIINGWNTIFTQLINGIGKIQLQLYSAIWCSILNIPLAIVLGRHFGMSGVILSTIILAFINSIWITMQYYKLINNTAKNLWAK